MKRNFIAILITVILLVSFVGCGSGKEEEQTMQDSAQTDTSESESVQFGNMEKDISEESPEVSASGDINGENEYIEQRDIFVCSKIDIGDGTEIDFSNQESISGPFVFTESIDIYSYFLTYAGYTKPNIEIHSVGKVGDWIFVPFAQSSFLVKADDFDRVAVLQDKGEEFVAVQDTTDTLPTEKDMQAVREPVAETTVEAPVQISDKYTPEEAVSIYRSLMEAGGMTWDPSLKDVTSWGTGWIYLEKGQPEWLAETNLESAAMGDSAGRSWTKYYLEVTGSDENAVYITEWTSNLCGTCGDLGVI